MKRYDPEQLPLFSAESHLKVRIVEYLILISPSDEVKAHVKGLKEKLHQLIGLSEENLKAIPHIPLFDNKYKEDDLGVGQRLNEAFVSQYRFPVQISGLRVIENWDKSKTLVLDITSADLISTMSKSIKTALGVKGKESTPYLTIAKAIPKEDFKKLKSLADFEYKGKFLCKGITVLKKATLANGDLKMAKVHETNFRR